MSNDWQAIFLTIKLATLTTTILMIVGTPIAWWLARTSHWLKQPIASVVALPIVLPPTVLGFYLLVLMGPNGPVGKFTQMLGLGTLPFTLTGLVVASVVYSLPFLVQPLQNAFEALVDWVENGKAPEMIPAQTKTRGGEVTRSRPLCPYPQTAICNGSGSTDDAGNFHCNGNLETPEIVCRDVLVKYKEKASGSPDYSGTGVNQRMCKKRNQPIHRIDNSRTHYYEPHLRKFRRGAGPSLSAAFFNIDRIQICPGSLS